MGDLRLITSAYPGKCRVCRTPHQKGGQVWWRKGENGVVCGTCKPNVQPETPRPVPSSPKPTPRPSRPYSRPSGGAPKTIDRFSSWSEFEKVAVAGRKPDHHSTTGGAEFTGSESWEDALELSRKGWGEIRPAVDALVEKMEAKIAPVLQPAFTSYFDVSGGMVDVGRFMDGEPECMVETRLIETARPGKVISILVNGSFNAGTQGKAIQERGAAIVALVDALEKMQHSTEIDVEISCLEGLTTLIRVKNAEDGLDIDALMFAIAHPSALRRIYFAYLEGHKTFGYLADSTYGASSPLKMRAEVGAAIALDSVLNMDAAEWIERELTEFGLINREEQ